MLYHTLFTLRQWNIDHSIYGDFWFWIPVGFLLISFIIVINLPEKTNKILKKVVISCLILYTFVTLVTWTGLIYIYSRTMVVPANTVMIKGESVTLIKKDMVMPAYTIMAKGESVTLVKAAIVTPQDEKIFLLPCKAEEFKLGIAVSPITDNPKVRNLSYSLSFTRPADVKAIIFTQKMGEDWQQIFHDQILSWLYEYNERNSKSLSHYYNPYSTDQQAKFQKQIKGYLEPLMKEKYQDNIELKSVTFSD